MKKMIYLALLVAAPMAGNTQSITLGQNDAPQIGESWVDVHDFRYGVHAITPGGAAQTWNYANSFVADETTTTNFVSVAATPSNFATGFQAASLASYTPGDSIAVYFKKTATGFYIDGLGMNPVTDPSSGASVNSFKFNPDQLVVPAPFTFGNTRNYTSRLVLEGTLNNIPVRISTTTYQQFSADAYGSLTTPAGTYANTLRVREFSYSVDTTYINFGVWTPIVNSGPGDSTIVYTWYRNGPGARLMSIQEDVNAPGTSEMANYLSQIITSAPENVAAAAKANVYPNPSAGATVTFEMEDALARQLVITDMLGRQVKTENVQGLNRLVMSTTQLQAGTYLYSLTDKNGNTTANGRFVVAK